MSRIEDLINSLDSGNVSNSNRVFNGILSDRISTALYNKKIELANNVYNGTTLQGEDFEEDDKFSDFETETE